VLEASVGSSGVDAGGEGQLRDVAEPLEFRGIDDCSDAWCEGHILFDGDAQDTD
jgi:hypothetical protein